MLRLGQISIAAELNLKKSQSGVKMNPGGSILLSIGVADLYRLANDPGPRMIPEPQMIPKLYRK